MTTSSLTGPALMPATVLDAAARSPRFLLTRSWRLRACEDGWEVLVEEHRSALPQPVLVDVGAAVQRMVLAVEASGRRVQVRLLPPGDPHVVAVLRCGGPGPASPAAALLAAEPPYPAPAPRELTASDLRRLNLTAEGFGCELLWQRDVAPTAVRRHAQRLPALGTATSLSTVVTRGDEPADWFAAGRAVAECELLAVALGLTVDQAPHALGHKEVRAEVRDTWRLAGWPQAQLTFVTSAAML